MKIERLKVSINFSGDAIGVGELVSSSKKIYFKYDADFLTLGLNISPIKLPFNADIHSVDLRIFDGLYGVFYDSLPDNWGRLLLDRKLSAQGINPAEIGSLERLAFVGKNGMGALEYVPSLEHEMQEFPKIDLDNLYAESRNVILGADTSMLDELYMLGGSSGGARPKVNVCIDKTRCNIISGSESITENIEPWIIKFPASIDKVDIANIEYAYSLMAREAGIEMAICSLFEGRSGQMYFGTERFDRIGKKRLHLHSASGMIHDDYRYSQLDYGHIMDCTFQLEKTVVAYEKVLRLAAFNVYCHNRDDHSKNFSFLMDEKGQWKLAPAYDLTFSSSSHGFHSTMVAGESQNPGKKQLLELAKIFSMKNATQIIDEVKSAANNWGYFAKEAGVSKTSSKIISTAIQKMLKA